MTAIVRRTRNGNVTKIIGDYQSKREFKQDLIGNGYRVLGIYTQKQIDEIKNGSKKLNPLDDLGDAYEYIRQCL